MKYQSEKKARMELSPLTSAVTCITMPLSFGSDEPSSKDGVVLRDTPVVMLESVTTFTLELLERYEK